MSSRPPERPRGYGALRPATSLAVAAALAGIRLPWPDRDELGGILAVEFLVLIFAMLLGPLAALRLSGPRAELVRWYAFACLAPPTSSS
jgi:hypothetical protein